MEGVASETNIGDAAGGCACFNEAVTSPEMDFGGGGHETYGEGNVIWFRRMEEALPSPIPMQPLIGSVIAQRSEKMRLLSVEATDDIRNGHEVNSLSEVGPNSCISSVSISYLLIHR